MGYLCKAATQARSLALLPRLVTVCVRDGPRQLSSLPRQQNPRSPWQQDKTSVYKITSGLQSRKFSVMGGLKGAAELRHTPLPALVLGVGGENKTFLIVSLSDRSFYWARGCGLLQGFTGQFVGRLLVVMVCPRCCPLRSPSPLHGVLQWRVLFLTRARPSSLRGCYTFIYW